MALDCTHNTTGLAFIATQKFLVTYCITFVYFLLCVIPFRVQLVDTLHKLLCFDIFTSIFVKILCIWNIILGLYWVVHECGHSQAPKLKLHKEKHEQDQQPLQSALPLKDEYLVGTQTRQTLVIEDNSSLLTPLTIDEPEWKETVQMKKQLESTTDTKSQQFIELYSCKIQHDVEKLESFFWSRTLVTESQVHIALISQKR